MSQFLRWILRATAVLVVIPASGFAAPHDAAWLDAVDGSWTDATSWSTDPDFPDNGTPTPSDTYDVLIDAIDPLGLPYVVTLDSAVSITSLRIDVGGASLAVQSSALTVSDAVSLVSGTFTAIDAVLSFENVVVSGGSFTTLDSMLSPGGLQLDTDDPSLYFESSTIQLMGDALLTTGSVVVDDTVVVGGNWTLAGGSLYFTNDFGNALDGATIIGDLDLTHFFSGDLHLRNGASFTGTARIGTQSMLYIDTSLVMTGVVVEIDGLTRQFEGIRLGQGTTLELDETSRVDLWSDGATLGQVQEGTLINRGLISVLPVHSDFQIFFINPGILENYGTLDIEGPGSIRVGAFTGTAAEWVNQVGGLIDIDGARVDFNGSGLNLGTMIATNDAEVSINGTWDNNGDVELFDSDLVLNGDFQSEDLGTITGSGVSMLALEGELDNRGNVLSFEDASLGLRLQGGSILGGSIEFSGGASMVSADQTDSILDGVEILGDLEVSSFLSGVELINGARFTGHATVDNVGTLGFSQTISIDGVTIDLDDEGPGRARFGVGGSNTLTLGPSTVVRMSGDASRITSDLFQEGDGVVVNQGQIEVDGSIFNDYTIDPDSFINSGTVSRATISISNGALLIGRPGSTWTNEASGLLSVSSNRIYFDGIGINRGTISAVDGSFLLLGGNWDNDGVIELDDSRLMLDGDFATQDIGSLSLTNGAILELRGTLDNSGETLLLDTLGGPQGLTGNHGSIVGGEIVQGLSSGLLESFTLDGVVVHGDLDLSDTSSTMTLRNGTFFDGSASVGRFSRLVFDESILIDDVDIDVDQGGIEVGDGHLLTFGPMTNVTLINRRSTIGNVSFQGDVEGTIVNQGLIRAVASIDFAIFPSHFENQGTVSLEGGGSLAIGAIDGTWTNEVSGSILASPFTALQLLGDWTNHGSIAMDNGRITTSLLTSEPGGTLDLSGTVVGSVENAGDFDVGGSGEIDTLAISGDLTLEPESVLSLEIGDAFTDFIAIDGIATVSGVLEISILSPAAASILPTDVFVLTEATGGISGLFSNVASGVRLASVDGLGSFEIHYGEAPYESQLVATNFLVPEPRPAALAIAALLTVGAVVSVRRRGAAVAA